MLRLLVGGAFILAGALKIGDPYGFQQDILNYRLVGLMPSAAAAFFLPPLEILCGLAVLTGFRPLYRGALLIIGGLMLVFATAYLLALFRGIDISCGCFGEMSEGFTPWQVITRDLVLLGATTALLAVDFLRPARK